MYQDTKNWALDVAIEIAKEAAKGGHNHPYVVLEETYKKLKELSEDVKSSG